MRKQGTIKTYDSSSHGGTVLDDQQNEYAFGPESFAESGLREFRLGQRVKFTVEGEAADAHIRDLTIVSF